MNKSWYVEFIIFFVTNELSHVYFSLNQAQYHLDRAAAKISALSSGELEKHEYLTGED